MFGYYGYGFGYFDPTIWLVLIGVVISLIAQSMVQGTFHKYESVRSRTGMTGAEAARRLLQSQGIYDVDIRPVGGRTITIPGPKPSTCRKRYIIPRRSPPSA